MDRRLAGQLQQERSGVDRLRRQLEAGLPDIPTLRRRIDDLSRVAGASVASMAMQRRLEVDGLYQRLRGLDPRATLRRGFAVVELVGTGMALTSTSQARPGDELLITVADGDVPAVAGSASDLPSDGAADAPSVSLPAQTRTTRKRKSKEAKPPASAMLL